MKDNNKGIRKKYLEKKSMGRGQSPLSFVSVSSLSLSLTLTRKVRRCLTLKSLNKCAEAAVSARPDSQEDEPKKKEIERLHGAKNVSKRRQSERTSEFVKVGQTSETSGGVRMMRGRDEALWCVCVCVGGGSPVKDILSIRSIA